MHTYKCRITLHNHIRKDGTRLIKLHSTINNDLSRIGLGIYVKPKHFDKKNQICVGEEYDYQNSVIENYKSSAFNLFKRARAFDRKLDKERFEYLLLNEALSKDFITYIQDKIPIEIKQKKLSLSTYKKYNNVLNLLRKFANRIEFADINGSWLKKWHSFLLSQKVAHGKRKGEPYAPNTITAFHSKVKKFIKLAIDDLDLSMKNPYDTFQLKWLLGDRVFLTPEELSKFVQLYDLRFELDFPHNLSESLRMFLFMCGSGLRISDAGRLTGLHIVDDAIKIRTKKNHKFRMASTFPMTNFSKKYLPTDMDGKLFSTKYGQTLNDNLKIICRYLQIDKEVTSHVARHTFATSFIIAGGNIVVLKELLGHSDIKTTMIYVHITKEIEKQELKLLDAFLDFD